MAASLKRFFMAGGLLFLALPVYAIEIELLSDPTRPAFGVSSAPDVGAGIAVQPVRKGLQSVIISPQRRAAVIDGVTVELGGKAGDATLVEVRESSVVLQGAQGRRVMELFPGVRMKKVKAATPEVSKETQNNNASETMSLEQANKDERVVK